MITLITMTQGNPIALKRTIDNVVEWFDGRVNEVIVGDLCIFQDDRDIINTYGVRVIPMPFNEIFHKGFADVLNQLSFHATNNLCLYMNVSEVIESFIRLDAFDQPGYNCYQFDHATETHKWTRLWNRAELRWSGRIHEEIVGSKRQYPQVVFRMADTEKDNHNQYKAAVYNCVKELVYFNQYLTLVDDPRQKGATNDGWVQYAKRDYDYIKKRMLANPLRYEAFRDGKLDAFLRECREFEPTQNSDIIHYQ